MNRKEWKIRFPLCLMLLMLCSANFLYAADPAGNVVINEFMADNATTVADQDGEYDDWIELYNKSSEAISLAGCYLTDKTANLTKWTFPAGAAIPGGGYLIVWADEDTAQTGLHAGFSLSKSGESIVLSAPDQTIIDQITFGAQKTDVSLGRFPNGTGNFIAMRPTFSAENVVIAGDVDGDSSVGLPDVILSLQVSVGVTPSATLYAAADVNRDSRIGLPEAVYALRTVAAQEDAGDGITDILLKGNSITVDGTGATADGSTVTIASAGTYNISGTLTDGQIVVNTADSGTVNLVLNGINVTCSKTSPLYVMSAKETVIVLAENTQNYVTDGSTYIFPDAETDEPDAAIFSRDDLRIEGTGSLTVKGNYSDGIAGKDGLVIAGGTISVTSADDGIRGRDWLMVKDGNITINARGDGMKSTNDEDTAKGYVSVENGTFNITAAGDGIQAETNAVISGGTFTLTTGGGSSYTVSGDNSAKGIKGNAGVNIAGGNFTISSADDTIHSNGSIVISGGTFALSSGDDGIHADTSLEISGGDILISKSYEGIESQLITIDSGTVRIVSSDDGVNVAGGVDGSGMPGWPGGFVPAGNYWLYVNGGYIAVNAGGDGIDVNGSIVMTGGTVIVHGPTANDNGALDYDGSFKLTGGFLVAAGSAGMAQAPGTTSTQNSLLLTFNSAKTAGTLVHIRNSTGTGILTFAPSKTWQSIAFSSPDLAKGSSYTVYYGGSSTGTVTDGLYANGTYTPGTLYKTFTVSSVVTSIR